jgi:uncharacterized protein
MASPPSEYAPIVEAILAHYPDVQAVYLFGSYGTEGQWPNSDVDIALLLPAAAAKRVGSLAVSELHEALERLLGRSVDLVNVRLVFTVFQKQIVAAERRIFCADAYAADEFEMLVLSFYHKLNEERAEVMAEGLSSGRFYAI